MKKSELLWMACISFALAIFTSVIVPVQTYLGSPEIFDFSISRLLAEGAACACAMGILLTVLGAVLARFLGQRILSLWMGLLICLYLETGILSIGLPPMNGLPAMGNVIRSVIDFTVLGGILMFVLLSHRLIVHYLKWIFFATIVMIVSSVFDAKSDVTGVADSPLKDGMYPRYDILHNIEFSKNRNVLVYILDMTPGSIAAKVMEENCELQKLFPGFVAFRENKGMHECTARGLPGLMTGKYYDGVGSECRYRESVFGPDSFLIDYVTNNIAVYFSGGAHDNGYTNRHKETYRLPSVPTVGKKGSVFLQHTPSVPYIRMIDSVLYRITPYRFKFKILNEALARTAKFKTPMEPIENELPVYQVLSSAKINDEPMSLCVVHTKGLHWPITFDRNGKELKETSTIKRGQASVGMTLYRRQMTEAGVYVFSLLGEHLKALRMSGIYDNATILVVADHGCCIMKDGKNDGAEDSIFWVKVPHATQPFMFSDAPTTTSKVHDLVVAAKDSDLTELQAEKMLILSNRLFRAGWHGQILAGLTGRLHYRDWIYDAKGNLIRIEESKVKR